MSEVINLNKIQGSAKIGRNVRITHCDGQRLNQDTKEFEDYHIDFVGVYDEDRATRYARRIEHDKTIVITHVELETHYYSMDVFDFIRYAERTN